MFKLIGTGLIGSHQSAKELGMADWLTQIFLLYVVYDVMLVGNMQSALQLWHPLRVCSQ